MKKTAKKDITTPKKDKLSTIVAKVRKTTKKSKLYDFKEGDFTKRSTEELANAMLHMGSAYVQATLDDNGVPNAVELNKMKMGFMSGIISAGYTVKDYEDAEELAAQKLNA